MHRTMKKVQGLLSFRLVLGLLVSPAPGNAVAETAVTDQVTAVTMAGDWLTANQNTDGGFGWTLPVSDISYHNVLGITAIGILKAYEFDPKPAYEAGLANALAYTVNTPPQYLWSDTASRYIENTKGIDSSPDFNFLIWLAQAAASDPSLLTAINDLQEPDITAPEIAALAKTRWDEKVVHWGSDQQDPPDGTAAKMAERLRDDRHNQTLDAVGIWDIELAISAAYALDSYFPGEGYDQQALDMVEVLYAAIDDGIYFDSMDTGQSDYVVGLTGAIKAFVETGQHLDKAASLNAILQSLQQVDGSWYYYGSTPATKSVQSTAYAILALNSMGDPESVLAANQAADWLVKNQKIGGGWYAENGTGDEILEVDSEAAWALATLPPPATIDSLGYYTIQSAIDSGNPGDTILVSPGTYPEDLEVNKSITLVGPNAEISPNGGARTAEAAIMPVDEGLAVPDPAVKITSQGISVTLKGIKFDMNDGGENDRFVDMIGKQNVTLAFEKNIFTGADECVNGNWYISGDNTGFNLTIDDNYFTQNIVSNGIALFSATVHNITVTNNTWEDNQGWAMNFNNVHGVISNNTFLDKIDNGPEWYNDQVGLILASANNDLVMSNNVFDGIISPAVNLYGGFDGILLAEHNQFKNIQGDLAAVRVREATADINGVVFQCNQFENNYLDISNPTTAQFAASNNWWRSITGPTISKFVGDVNYAPWCGDAACTFLMPPVVVDQAVTTSYQTPVTITLSAPNVGENILTWTIIDPPTNGVLSGAGPTLTYTPDPGYSGSDSFTFKGSIEGVESNLGTVTITVSEPFIYYFPIIANN